uniref:Uncharacterized protein LOC100183982 n=1 Tax=Phallusia mammillata TaxID=59560 RepID=A0A6F9DHA5_9ASCI|nr:uncharacterized protein LOC100183982 [Phallusia mammillata]
MSEIQEKPGYGALDNVDDSTAPPYTESNEATVESGPPPPSYGETQNEAPPPTYESLYGEIQEARRNATGRGNFLKNVCIILFSTIGFTILIGILLSIPIAMIAVGAINLNNCPMERLIPIWLIVGGCVSGLMQIFSIGKRIKAKCNNEPPDNEEQGRFYNSCNGLLGCFNCAWFFAGNVWVYRYYRPENTTIPGLPNYCDPATYYLAFAIITIVYAIIALVCCCSCCIAMCAGAASDSNN